MKTAFRIFFAAVFVCLASSCSKEPSTPEPPKPCFVYAETLQPITDEYVCQFNSKYEPRFVAFDGKEILPVDNTRNFMKFEFLDGANQYFCHAGLSAETYQIDGWCFAFGALVTTNPGQTGSVRVSYDDGTIQFEKTLSLVADPEAYSAPVDLGLSVKWAQCNLGALRPENNGLYYQWGDTQGYGSDTSDGKYFNWKDSNGNASYKWCNGSQTTFTKYNTTSSSYGTVDNKSVLDMEDDAARAALGDKWRMPTQAEWAELRNTSNCSWTWTKINDINGYKVQSLKSGFTDNWIFLPAGGYRDSDAMRYFGTYGYYWSSSLDAECPNGAYRILFTSSSISKNSYGLRCYGQAVRPVTE